MAFIYEVNGQRVEFEKEPTEKDIDEAAKSLRPAPQPTRKVVEGAGGGAIVYPNMGRRPENQNQNRQENKDMPIQTARGVITGALGGPSDLLNLPGVLYGAATGQQSPYTVPYGSEQFNEMLPFKSDAPSAKLARLGGEVMAPFPSLKGLKAIPGAVRGAGDVVSGAVGTGTGYIARPGKAPVGYQVPSQRNPIGPTFTPPEELAKFERGELPYGQMPEQRPINELPEGRLDRAAMMLSGGNIPNAGQGAKAFGERLGETYRNPITAALDIGSLFIPGNPGVPLLSTLRGGLAGVQALADMRLANKGFTPDLPKILEQYQTGVRPMPGVQPGPMPRGFQAAGPISPGGLAQPTSAAQAAMATTQRVARTTAAPRPQAQPFVLPDAGTHYTQAEQVGNNFGDIFNKAVTARATDLLRDARQTGKSLTSQQANDLAFDEIKEFRRNNVDAFKPAPEPTGPDIAQPGETPALVKTPGEGTLDKPNVEFDRSDWFKLQEKIRSGKPLTAGEQSLADKITGRYGPDPFGSGDLTGQKMFNTVAQGENTPVPDPFQTGNLTGETVLETPKRKNVKQETRVKEMEAERTKDMTPEQIAAEEQANLARMKRMADPTSAFQRALRGDYGSVKTTPKTKSILEEPLNTAMPENTPKSELKKGETFTVNDDNFDAPSFTGIEKELQNKIPKKTKWVKQTHYMDANDDIAVTEYYSKATKNQPEYKFVDKFINEGDDFSELYVKKGNNWELVADEKTIVDAKEAASKADHEQKMKAYYEPIRQEINMTLDEFMALPGDKLIELGKQIKKSKGKPPPGVMKMTTGPTTHANITDAAGDLMVKQMTNNTGMFETSYNKGKDIVFEKKYPGYHSVEITHPDGTQTVYKKHEIAGSTEYSRNTIDKNGVYSQFEQSRSKPKGWSSVEDEITKGK